MSETAQSRWGPGARRRSDQPAAVFTVGAAGSGSEPLARALASLGPCSAIGEEPAPVADLGRDGDRREGTPGRAGARTIRSAGGHLTTVVDGAPRRALQVPRLAEVYEPARFVLCRRPAAAAASVALAGWRSGRHVSHPDLPGWSGPPWSYALIPGWRDLAGQELAAIVVAQWRVTMRIAADDLASLAAGSVTATSFDALASEPRVELGRIAAALAIEPAGLESAARSLASDLARLAAPPQAPPELAPLLTELEDAEAEVARALAERGLGPG